MKTFTKVMSVIAICIGISGLFFVIGGFVTGGKIADLIEADSSPKECINDSYSFTDTIDSLDIHINAAETNVIYGDNFGVDLQNVEKDSVQVKVEGTTLKVREDAYRTKNFFGHTIYYSWPFQINIGNKTIGKKSSVRPKIIIYIPKGMELKEADIDVDSGSINIDELTAKEGKWTVDTGCIKAGKISLSEESKMDVSVGSITIDELTAKDTCLSVDVGAMKVAGELTGKCKADCNVGGISLDLNQEEDQFDYKIDSDLGKVELNQQSIHGRKKNINHDAENSLKLSCDIGKITVKTK